MKINVGTLDRVVRVIVGAGLLVWAVFGGPLWTWIGIVPLATGLARRCPAYQVIGVSTCGAEAKP